MRAWVIAGCWLASLATSAAEERTGSFHLTGLDRLYFERVEPRAVPAETRALLPDVLTKAAHEADGDVAVRDLPIPGARRVVLRELVDARHPRIVETWWAVYTGGRRGDVWRYSPATALADGKALPNLRIEDLAASDSGRVVVRLAGRMARPQGAWSIVGKAATFDAKGGGLTLAHVRNAFGLFHGYDTGTPPSIGVASEREVADRFEERRLDPAPEAVLARCGFVDEEGGALSWDAMDRIASCVTGAPGHTIARRSRDAPSFAERGGPVR